MIAKYLSPSPLAVLIICQVGIIGSVIFFAPMLPPLILLSLILGAVLSFSGQSYFILFKKWEGETPKTVWDGGPFRIARHPFYGGLMIMSLSVVMVDIYSLASITYDLFTIGMLGELRSFFLNSLFIALSFLLATIFFVCLLVKASLEQEAELLEVLGPEAEKYFKKVKKRWIPFII